MANKLTYQTGEPDIFVDGGPRKTCPYCGGGNVKILLPGTKLQGLAGNGEQRGETACRPRGPIVLQSLRDF